MIYTVVKAQVKPAVDPSILCHPNIPKPLQGVAPRKIAGDTWWKRERERVLAISEYCCQACDTHVTKVLGKKKWLEAHEFYMYDYEKGRLTFEKVVTLCPYCHSFIHSGRLEMLYNTGEIDDETYEAILAHGNSVLKAAGLTARWQTRHDHLCSVPWEDWRLVFRGVEYGPSSKSFSDWENGAWKTWKPTR